MKNSTFFIFLFIVILLCFFFFGSLFINKSLNDKLKKAESAISEFQKNYKEVQQKNEELKKENSLLEKNYQEILKKAEEASKKIEESKNRIAELEKQRPATPPECQEIVAHYLKEIEEWKNAFSLVSEERDYYKFTLVPNLQLQIKNYQTIVSSLEERLDLSSRLLENNKYLMRDMRSSLMVNWWEKFSLKACFAVFIGTLVYIIIAR